MKPHKKAATVVKPPAPAVRQMPGWIYPAAIALCVLVFYWVPLTSGAASIQWDAADMHYPLQRYWSDHLRAGAMPFWTPYLFAGYPFLANPEVAAWYPPHWPFFLTGITPWGIQAEIAITALLACFGAYVLLAPMVGRPAAVFGGLGYGLSGFFAGHASHVGLAASAAWLPWVLAAYNRAIERPAARYAALGAAAGGCMLLAGYFQTALYGFLAVGCFAVADAVVKRRAWARVVAILAGMTAGAGAVAAIEVLPALELTTHSARAAEDYSASTEGTLHVAPLATLVAPDALGAISGRYSGPGDVTQYYWYAGLLLLPLAVVGAARSPMRIPALAMLVPALWYMAGPAAGFFRIGAMIPFLHKLRAPIQGWFIAALALAMLGAGGVAWIGGRWRRAWIPAALIALLFVDLWARNSLNNPLAYASASFGELYGAREAMARAQIAATQPPLTRFDEPQNSLPLGPLDHALDLRLDSTSGYFALAPLRMLEYIQATSRNPRLRAGANATRWINTQTGAIESAAAMPRAYFPKAVREVADSRQALETLDPAAESVVEAGQGAVQQDAAATASVTAHGERSYKVAYRTGARSLLKLTEGWFPGWHAYSGGAELPIVRVDHAFQGVVLPAGSGEVEFEYRPNRFGLGAGISIVALGLLVAAVFRRDPLH
jgi:hypothetical protein